MKIFTLTISLIICTNFLFSQNLTENKPSHYLGFNAGFTTGVGLTYRHWNNDMGFQLTATPININENWSDLSGIGNYYSNYHHSIHNSETIVSLGATGFYKLKQLNNSKLFSYLGNHLFIRDNYQVYNIGVGLGISFETIVGISLMVGYQGYDVTNKFNILPTAEVSLMYKLSKK